MTVVSFRADTALSGALTAAAAASGQTVSEVARTGLQRAYAVDRPTYGVGSPHSFVADIGAMVFYNGGTDPGAAQRLAQLRRDQRAAATFALGTADLNQAVPPAYRPEGWLPPAAGRPLHAAAHPAPISDATPFSVPTFVSSSGEVAAHVEHVNPSAGSYVAGTRIVAPQGRSGVYRLTRELVDSSNPAADLVALAAMRAEYSRQTETVVYTELNGSNGQAGTVTTGQVPSGAWVTESVSVANTPATVRALAIRHPFRHPTQSAVRSIVVNEPAAVALESIDTTDRWLSGVAVTPAPALTGETTSDGAVFALAVDDLWVWESPHLEFRWQERAGPAFVDVSLFAYYACALLRPAGLAAIRLSGS